MLIILIKKINLVVFICIYVPQYPSTYMQVSTKLLTEILNVPLIFKLIIVI